MKTKPIILMAVLSLGGLCFGQSEEQQTAFDKEWDQSAQIASFYYPNSAVAETPIAKKILELDERMQAADAPLYYSPKKPFILCQIAATELGIKPTSPIPDSLMRVVSEAIAENSKSSKTKLPPVETGVKDGGKNEVIPEFNGYNNVMIRGIDPDGIRIIHESGAAKIPIERLTLAQRATFGLAAEGASEYRAKQAAAAAANQARQQSVRQERIQAEQPQISTPSTAASDAEAKKAAFDAWIAQGGGLIDSSGSAPGSRRPIYRQGPQKGMTHDQARQKFESIWAATPASVREKYRQRASGGTLPPRKQSPVAGVDTSEINRRLAEIERQQQEAERKRQEIEWQQRDAERKQREIEQQQEEIERRQRELIE